MNITFEYRGIIINGSVIDTGNSYSINITSPIDRPSIEIIPYLFSRDIEDYATRSIKEYIKVNGLDI